MAFNKKVSQYFFSVFCTMDALEISLDTPCECLFLCSVTRDRRGGVRSKGKGNLVQTCAGPCDQPRGKSTSNI